jgi:hypothetical protein
LKIKNKNSGVYLQYFILLIFIFSSCAGKKNLNFNGVCLWHGGSQVKEEKESRKKINPYAFKNTVKSNKGLQGFENLAGLMPVNPAGVLNSEIKFQGKIHPASKKIKTRDSAKLIPLRKNMLATAPNPPQKHKISIGTINTIGTVSLLHIPLLIIAIILDLSALFWGFLILGPLLAIIGALLSRHRKGTWVVGVACGFWLIILTYGAVLIFL